MKYNGDEEGDEIASRGHSEGQANKDGMENDSRLKNGDAQGLRRCGGAVKLALGGWGDVMVMS